MIDRINLIPEEFAPKKINFFLPLKYIILVALALGIIVPLHQKVTRESKSTLAKEQELMRKSIKLQADNVRFVKLKTEVDKKRVEIELLHTRSKALKGIVKNKLLWSEVLKEVSYLVPEKVWLSEVFSQTSTVIINDRSAAEGTNGDAEGDDSGSEKKENQKNIVEKSEKKVTIRGSSFNGKLVSVFIANLEKSYFLEDIKLDYLKKRIDTKKTVTYNFKIVSKLKEALK